MGCGFFIFRLRAGVVGLLEICILRLAGCSPADSYLPIALVSLPPSHWFSALASCAAAGGHLPGVGPAPAPDGPHYGGGHGQAGTFCVGVRAGHHGRCHRRRKRPLHAQHRPRRYGRGFGYGLRGREKANQAPDAAPDHGLRAGCRGREFGRSGGTAPRKSRLRDSAARAAAEGA